jgi:glyoxylase-like metal-dependent hydrolase (beta-lactamase superfamily II)
VETVEWVLFTHHHREQCQGVEKLDRNMTRVAVPEGELDLFEKPTQFRKWFPTLGDVFSVYGASYVRPPRRAVKVDRALEPGERFAWHGYELECLNTPGHSPASMTYLLRHNGSTALFTGGTIHDGAKMTTWFDTEWDYGFGKGLDTLLKSVEMLMEKQPDLALPSQGPPILNPQTQLKNYHEKLTAFREDYLRGYPVFNSTEQDRDAISQPTPVPLISQVTPHLYKLSHKTQGKNFAIIISDSGRGLVLDCGLFPEAMLEEIIVGLRTHMGLSEIDAFWVSHMHGDHFLLGPAMKEKYNAKAWTLDMIVDKCENPRRYDYSALVSAYGDGFDGMKIDRSFHDGEVIEWEGYKIQIDWMPGQTEFGCCLWLELDGKRIAFTGDNLFGNTEDIKQDGHEAVVARNSAIFEEGYLLGAQYLKDLKPDIIMGSHSYVMHNPAEFLNRYHDWAKRIIQRYQDLLPDRDYEYLFDPYWVSAYPYRVDFSHADVQNITVTVRNFRDAPQHHRVKLKLPPGMTAEPEILEGTVEANSRGTFPVQLSVNRQTVPAGLQIIPFDITLDGKTYGEVFDFIIRSGE